MKVRAYTIEWVETIYPYEDKPYASRKVKHITAFDTYAAARAKAIELLKKRTEGVHINEHQEFHDVDKNGMVYDRLRVKGWRQWYQVTIKYHAAPPAYNAIKFW